MLRHMATAGSIWVMNTKYQSGQSVRLRSAVAEIERVVVRDLGLVVLVCTPEEYQRAKDEGRVPAAAAFRRQDILN